MAEFNCEACRVELLSNIKSNQHRVDEVENKVEDMYSIVICIREIAVEMRGMKEAQEEIKRNQEKSQEEYKRGQDRLEQQIHAVESRPGNKAAAYIDRAVNAVIAALVAFIMANILNK